MDSHEEFLRLLDVLELDRAQGTEWFAVASRLPPDSRQAYFDAFRWASGAIEECSEHLTRPVVDYLRATRPPSTLRSEAMFLDHALARIAADPTCIIDSTESTVAALLALVDPRDAGIAGRIRSVVPEWRALTSGSPIYATGEHDPAKQFPLLENLAERTLNRSLRALETGDRSLFPSGTELSDSMFAQHCETVARLDSTGLLPAIRAALTFLDFTKAGTEPMRADWRARGVDLTVHNTASRAVIEREGRLSAFPQIADRGASELVLALIESHGMIGQIVRGDSTWVMLEQIADRLSRADAALKAKGPSSPSLVVDALHVVNICDTAAVRFGLWNDSLAAKFAKITGHLGAMTAGGGAGDCWETELSQHGDKRAWLTDRLRKLRARRLADGEPSDEVEKTVASLSEQDVDGVVEQLRHAQIWYGEAATADLRPDTQLKLLTLASASVGSDSLHHMNLAPLMRLLNDGSRTADYRVRLVDAMLENTTVEDILAGTADTGPLVALETTIGGAAAGSIELQESPEATALLTLLPIYETKNSAAFHRTLKEMCDLYDLRKDEFDRVANESLYLKHMNSARSDKERMVEWCVPGSIVEVGPGGGVVLDLIEDRFPSSEVVGLDLSQMVCEALRARREAQGRTWKVIEGDAYELPAHVGPEGASTIVYCSVLHEIYSYVRWPMTSDVGEQFQIDSVRELIRASWKALAPGGRIVIRDGIRPPDAVRRIRFKDPHGPEFLKLFADQFEGRPIEYEWVDANTAELSAPDAMEFLYCYTWGPASFPYEVREQYGVLEYDVYVRSILQWVSDLDGTARVVEIPPDERSYLQPGYVHGLAPLVDLLDKAGNPTPLPDSNCLIVVEKAEG